jgi:hypothetical protein
MEQAARMWVAKHRSQEKQAMRALILVVAVLAVLANAGAAQASLSTTPREVVASDDTAPSPETNRPDRVRTEGRPHHPRSIGGPIGAVGHAIGGLFRR